MAPDSREPDGDPQLQYATPKPKSRRSVIVAALCILLAGAGVLVRRPAAEWITARYRLWALYRAQQRCMTYTPPETAAPGQVVYDDSPSCASSLLRSGGEDYLPMDPPFAPPATQPHPVAVVHTPRAWRDFVTAADVVAPSQIIGPGSMRNSVLWGSSAAPQTPATAGGGMVFLHRMNTPAGHARLVCVTVALTVNPGDAYLATHAWVPGTASRPCSPCGVDWHLSIRKGSPGDRLQLYSGRIDPTNPSRFTITYRVGGRDGVIDGQLDDEDRVRLQPNTGWVRQRPSSGEWYATGSGFTLHEAKAPRKRFSVGAGLAIAYLPGGTELAVATETSVGVWDVNTGQRVRGFEFPGCLSGVSKGPPEMYKFRFSRDGSLLAAGRSDRWIVVDVRTGEKVASSPEGSPFDLDRFAFSSDGRFLTIVRSSNIDRWDLTTGKPIKSWKARAWDAADAGGQIAAVTHNTLQGGVTLFDPDAGPEGPAVRHFGAPRQDYHRTDFSPDGNLLATADQSEVYVFDAGTGRQVIRRAPPDTGVSLPEPLFSSDGRLVAFRGNEFCYLFDVPDGSVMWRFPGCPSTRSAIAFAPDGQTLAVHSGDTVSLWDLADVLSDARIAGPPKAPPAPAD